MIIKQIGILLLFFFIACNKEKHIRVYKIPKANIEKKEEISLNKSLNKPNFKWDKPSSWVDVPGHKMRIASFRVPHQNGEGDLSITSFGGASGGTQANVNRWEKQIGLNASSMTDINKFSKSNIGKLGQYKIFKLINSNQKETAIIASIFQLKETTLFIKLSISSDGLEEMEDQFIKFCNSIDSSL
jgi:hypothetical protein|tara:strand:+ start:4051 stop:4608 length:558 start_codon:yes stop_codon:yes gene_type:complete